MSAPARRQLLKGIAVGGAGFSAALAAASTFLPALPAALGPDADLLTACAEFTDLNQQYRALCNSYGAEDVPDEAGASLEQRISSVADRMCALRATTAEGFRARGASLVHYMPEIARDGQHYVSDRVLAALMRDLSAGSAAA